MKWKKILIIGIFLLLFSIGLGDYLLTLNYNEIVLKPYQSTTISQAEVLANGPIRAQSIAGTLVEGTNTYSVISGPAVLINNNTKPISLVVIPNNLLLEIDYLLILISFGMILLSALLLFYNKVAKRR
ncbi:hypothetical protein [Sulfurisphaera ohwakuensis]|uniref:hypothetical protein n=1 Tax=Sulfurisphaera ohwakuensis TaxID=69656 RepID=UPI0036F1FFBE